MFMLYIIIYNYINIYIVKPVVNICIIKPAEIKSGNSIIKLILLNLFL